MRTWLVWVLLGEIRATNGFESLWGVERIIYDMVAFLLRLEAGTDFGCAMTSKLMDLVLRRLVKLGAPKVS